MDERREFTLGGIRYCTTRRQMAEQLVGIAPERIRTYYVEIGGLRYPVKQAVAVGLGADRAAFQSQEAYRVLRVLGFEPAAEARTA